jgi:hypothetical protein
MEIEITQRTNDFKANIKGEPGKWDCGKTVAEAIGNLILTWPKEFNIKID